MSRVPELSASGVAVVAGKGGVGKTTVTAVLARAASDAGLRVLVIELDGKATLCSLLPGLEVRSMSGAESLEEYLRDHGFARIASRLVSSGVIDLVGTAAPGIDDLVVLGKIKQLERSGQWDLIVVDGPAAGHAISFLTTAAGMLDAVRGGPVRAQAQEVLDLLTDAERCQVVLVTLPETTPVNEVIETAAALESRVGVKLGPILVNRVDATGELPDPGAVDGVDDSDDAEFDALVAAAGFRTSRRAIEQAQIERLADALPLDQIVVRACPVAGLSAADVQQLANELRGVASEEKA